MILNINQISELTSKELWDFLWGLEKEKILEIRNMVNTILELKDK